MYRKRPGDEIGSLISKLVRDALSSSHVNELSDIGELIKKKMSNNPNGDTPAGDTPAGDITPPPPDRASYKRPPSPASTDIARSTKEIASLIPLVIPSGILSIVFGALGSCIFMIMLLFSLLSIVAGSGFRGGIVSLVMLMFLCVGVGVTLFGLSTLDRQKRFRRIAALCKDKKFFFMNDMVTESGLSRQRLVRDIRRMLLMGYLPNAHFDSLESCLMLDIETYKQYLRADEEMKKKQIDEQKRQKELSGNEELDKTIATGQDYIRRMREANRLIPGEEISLKISRIDGITSKIFDCIAEHPEKLPELRKFMSYYLPTTQKLLDTYAKFEANAVQGENIQKTKREIERSLDTISVAFENLLDSLYRDEALDVSTDISVLESMLAQEGLTADGFKTSDTK